MTTAARAALIALITLIVLAFATYVWPTPYRYFTPGSAMAAAFVSSVRENRFTGRVEMLYLGSWSDSAHLTPHR
jgi:hypothetical protein